MDLGSYKERCKDLETELEHIRGNSHNSGSESQLLGYNQSVSYAGGKANTTFTGLNQSRVGNYDFEVKKMKDMFQQQLTKAKEEASKYRTQARDFEGKLKAFEEEAQAKYKESISQTSEKLEKDQQQLNQIFKLKSELNQYKRDIETIR